MEAAHPLKPGRKGQKGSEVSLPPTQREENDYLKLRAQVDQGASLTFTLFANPKSEHRGHGIVSVSIH